jgi:hypothetical protein
LSKGFGLRSEPAQGNDVYLVGPVVVHQPKLFAHDGRAYLGLPVLDLHQAPATAPAQEQVHPAIGPAQPIFFHAPPVTAIRLTDQALKVGPPHPMEGGQILGLAKQETPARPYQAPGQACEGGKAGKNQGHGLQAVRRRKGGNPPGEPQGRRQASQGNQAQRRRATRRSATGHV